MLALKETATLLVMSLGLFLFALVASLLGVHAVTAFLTRRNILDRPNERSSHSVATPRGAGLVLIPIIFVGLLIILAAQPIVWPSRAIWWAVCLGLFLLAVVSWLDDVRPNGVRRRIRLLVQLAAVSLPLFFWPGEWGRLFADFMPLGVERVLIALAWLWFLNLYNFMDGINGITGVETATIAWGLVLLGIVLPSDMTTGLSQVAALLFGASLGFLFWNGRARATIFLGDVGSIGFGYIIGWLLLVLASTGHLTAALLLPLVYLVDATYTLIKRAIARKKIWVAHREHFYQQATVHGGITHIRAAALIGAVNLLLIADAILVAKLGMWPVLGFGFGIVIVAALLVFFKKTANKATIF